jgi:hypothetical protein
MLVTNIQQFVDTKAYKKQKKKVTFSIPSLKLKRKENLIKNEI